MTASAPVTIRHLTSDDIALMRRVNAMFGAAFEEEGAAYAEKPPGTPYLRSLLEDRRFIALAATLGGDVVGGLAAYELVKFEQERSEIYIYDLAVAEAQRRQGVATRLIETVKGIAAERSAYVVIVQADRGDTPAISLYSKLGTREDVLHFDIEVGGAD